MQEVNKHNFPYHWNMKDWYQKKNECKVFWTFVCWWWSTMWYKLAWFEHIWWLELTEHYSRLYIENHKPKYFYQEDIRSWNNREDLPEELYQLDLLDWSPPCASFSTSWAREKKWWKWKEYEWHFQLTDDLVFEYVKTIWKLKPKAFLMENVSWLIKWNAKMYVRNIFKWLEAIWYTAQLFLINSATLWVPQSRHRVFIIGHKKELAYPKLLLDFNEPKIWFEEATKKYWSLWWEDFKKYAIYKNWLEIKWPKEISHPKRFNLYRPALDKPCNTLIESMSNLWMASVTHPIYPRKLNKEEACMIQSYPLDYNFLDQNPLSCIWRSVPPVMTAQIANQIYLQWLKK
jgi:DNA (cytosine-5)-methyltransferase 1